MNWIQDIQLAIQLIQTLLPIAAQFEQLFGGNHPSTTTIHDTIHAAAAHVASKLPPKQ